jgi:uncharacterized protein (DUF1697 family)
VEGGTVARFAALLRGVNVAGNSLSMADLVRVVESLGGRDVRTYLQSGNVVYTGGRRVADQLASALAEDVGVRTSVIARSGKELAATVEAKPFAVDGKAVSVTFLASAPDAQLVAAIDARAFGDDRFAVVGTEVFLHTPGGYGRTKLNNTFWERRLATTATTRNWNTVVALAELTA